jgi:hypothetical protein
MSPLIFADEREMKNREGKLSHEFTRMNTNFNNGIKS